MNVLTPQMNLNDCLENLFSVVRIRKPVPTPLEFKYALKTISCAQFLKVARSGSYEADDSAFLADFLNQPIAIPMEMKDMPNINLSHAQNMTELSSAELASLYHLAGYCLHSIEKSQKHCAVCFTEAVKGAGEHDHQSSKLTLLKEFREGALVQVSNKVFDVILCAEFLFRQVEASLITGTNIKKEILTRVELRTKDVDLPDCHGLKQKILAKYINVRLRIYCQKMNDESKKKYARTRTGGELGSKSMGMRKLVDNLK
uniref:uncharacterized protein n=1 Tax=Myxine glutinosa TaxID=7769 RepID=UPI00358E2E16